MAHTTKFSHRIYRLHVAQRCTYSDECGLGNKKKGLVLGAFDGCNTGEYKLTHTGAKFDATVGNRISDLLRGSGIKKGNARVFNNLGPEFYGVAVAGLGPEGLGYNEVETLNECKENVRIAASVGAQALQDMRVSNIMVEGFTNAEAAAEGSTLGVWRFQKYKNKESWKTECKVSLYDDPDVDGWSRGIMKASSQNVARALEEAPANKMKPSDFAQAAIKILCPCGVQVDVRDRDWLESKHLTAFLATAKGSCDPPLLLEVSYCGGGQDDKPVILVGKGSTFDSGGLCLRKCKGMSEFKADMAGAAVCVGTLKALATMHVPINVNALIPLCENMPGGMANRPGDVMFSLNNKSIRFENAAKDGRIMMADALAYSINYKPCLVMSLGTTSRGARVALGASSTAVYCNSNVVWREMERAGAETGDRAWRMPLWRYFGKKVTQDAAFDVNNVGTGRGGDPCLGAAFLLQFMPPVDFVHMDITGTGMLSTGLGYPYLKKGMMTGRPTRTLAQFLYQMACPLDQPPPC